MWRQQCSSDDSDGYRGSGPSPQSAERGPESEPAGSGARLRTLVAGCYTCCSELGTLNCRTCDREEGGPGLKAAWHQPLLHRLQPPGLSFSYSLRAGRWGDLTEQSAASAQILHSLNCVPLFATPWTAAHQASLTFTIS